MGTVLLLSGCARVLIQPSVDLSRHATLAVFPFDTDTVVTGGQQLADEIVIHLLQKAPSLDLVERGRLDLLLREQQLSGYLSPETAVAVGRLMGARAILVGSLSLGEAQTEATPLGARRALAGAATVRLVDTETGKIIWVRRETSQAVALILDSGQPTGMQTDHDLRQTVIANLALKLAMHFYPHYELR